MEASHTYQMAGTYDATLRVTDNDGFTHSASLTITVTEPQPPVANANADNLKGFPPLIVSFVGTGTDVDGTIELFEWDFDSDGTYDWSSNATGQTVHTYPDVGVYDATLRVTDNDGNTDTDTIRITVNPGGYPIAVASADTTSGNMPLSVNFSGTGSDEDGLIVLYEWDFDGDGVYNWSHNRSATASYQYMSANTYYATLRVTDDDGFTDTDMVEITVNPTYNVHPDEQFFDPTVGETININSSLLETSIVTIRIVDQNGNPITTLVDSVMRPAGYYSDTWDGRDNGGDVVPSGVYYFIVEYTIDGQTFVFDPTNDEGERQTPNTTYQDKFSPFEDNPLNIRYTLPKPAEVTIYIFSNDWGALVKTILLREPQKAGDYVVDWDGTDDEGNIVPVAVYYVAVNAWYLPENSLIISSKPVVSDLSADPNYLNPAPNPYSSGGDSNVVVSYRLSKQCDIIAVVQDERNTLVKTMEFNDVSAGINTVSWNGRDNDGKLMADGKYKIGIKARDASGNESRMVYSLFVIFY